MSTSKSPISKFSAEEVYKFLEDSFNPTVFTFISNQEPVTIPIWTLYYEDKFYIFSGKTTQKVKAIESGNLKVALNVIHKDYYPHPISDVLSYIGIKGQAKIITYEDNNQVAAIQLKLLRKYDPDNEHKWINDLTDKIEGEPEKAWLIEIKPTKWFSF